jgi:hypothetical protein
MKKQIKIFNSGKPEDIEANVNNFLKKTVGKLHDVFYTRSSSWPEYSILITYTEEFERSPIEVNVPVERAKIVTLKI